MTDTSKRELIEGTAYERYPDIEADPPGTSAEDARFPTGWSRELERNAFIAGAVFEKAHTPTEHIVPCAKCGSRKVVATDAINSDIVVCDRCAWDAGRASTPTEAVSDDERTPYLPADLHNRLQAHLLGSHSREALLLAGEIRSLTGASTLRRPEVPMPDWASDRSADFDIATSRPLGPEPQGEPTDAPTVQLVARRGGKTRALIDSMLAQANERGIHVEVVYPQGEPTDAEVEAAWRTYEKIPPETFVMGPWIGKARDRMRAALTAAYETKGEGR
jgi:hypothetical protein